MQDIGKEVKKASRLMLNQLLQQLKGDIQLPACLRIIGYLRQLETFNEPELRIKFLQVIFVEEIYNMTQLKLYKSMLTKANPC